MRRAPRSQHGLSASALAILRGLFESRLMTVSHIAAIHCAGRYEAAKKMVQRLKTRGLVGEASLRVRAIGLTLAGVDALDTVGALNGYPPMSRRQRATRTRVSDLTLAHELAVLDVKAAFYRESGDSVSEFTTWPALAQFSAALPGLGERDVKPDGFLRLTVRHGAARSAFFLEVDRSTESLDVLVTRLRRYAAFQRSGGFAERCGGARTEAWAFPFRVLVVVESEERRNNVAEALLRCVPPVLTLVWIGTRRQALADPMSACWVCPADYRDATAAMPRPATGRGGWYRRDREREARIAALLRKRAIQGPDHKKGGPVAA